MHSSLPKRKPNSRRNLDMALQRRFGAGASLIQTRTAMAATIIGQMLPGAVFKGGTSLRIRYGRGGSRNTIDCDVARKGDLDSFVREARASLAAGWQGFSATHVAKRPARPKDVPAAYVMQPFEVKMVYLGGAWCTLPLEVGFNEIGLANEADMVCPAADIVELFTELGFPEPAPIPLMPLAWQVAQKLHGVTEPGNDRVRDLADLQLILKDGALDMKRVLEICKRLFKFRKRQPWPPKVTKGVRWDELYESLRGDLPVLPTVVEAIVWANDLIARIDAAK